MARERMCQFGNCTETTVQVTVNTGDERPAFCCPEHAGLWLLRESWKRGTRTQQAATEFASRVIGALQ